jgi:uncharacterized DUF497 family protein
MADFMFTWDTDKAEFNRRKHGISFEVALQVFHDPLHRSEQDRIEGGEYRWQTVGQVQGMIVILVAHTTTLNKLPEVIRIISARKATKAERRNYENQRR